MKRTIFLLALLTLAACGTIETRSSYYYSGQGDPSLLIGVTHAVDSATNALARGLRGEPIEASSTEVVHEEVGGVKTPGGAEYNWQRYTASGNHTARYDLPCIGC